MARDLDDIADERTMDLESDGEAFRENFLLTRPKAEWAPYIDDTAKDLSAGIQIGDLTITSDDFGREVGSYYRQGLKETTGTYADLPDVLDDSVSDANLGLLTYKLNELSYDITTTDLGIDAVQQATEAVIEKILTRNVGDDLQFTFQLTGGTVSDVVSQLFKHEPIADNVDLLLEAFDESANQGLLELLDKPQMMTPLWEHQFEALANWCANDCRGYVDMATATGKTVLGLGAIALRYGEVHPDDQELREKLNQSKLDRTGKADVLIVAHSDLILEQWRREFDCHLNIPRERIPRDDDITLEWGTVHFRTAQRLLNDDELDYDLVLLDEAHHYATGSQWGTLLDEIEGPVLAMSGSVDDAGSESERIQERLSNSLGSRAKRYTITEAKAHGVIPSFDWEVYYAPYQTTDDELAKTANRCERAFQRFQKQYERGELEIDSDRRLQTYEDIRSFSHTTEGRELKEENDEFRDLTTRLFSRRAKRWNLSPSLNAVVDLIEEHAVTENVVVLADSNAQVEEFETRLDDRLPDSTAIYTVSKDQSRERQLETVSDFDQPESAGVLLGTGDLLGEGVDMHHASVAINMATGGVNPELVQRIGRVLRNPEDTPKHAMFYNVVGIPAGTGAAVPREDGMRLIEDAAEFCSLGRQFDKLPGFASEENLDEVLGELLENGASWIDTLSTKYEYDWGSEQRAQEDTEALLRAINTTQTGTDEILGEWEEYAFEHSADDPREKPNANDSANLNDDVAEPSDSELVDKEIRQRVTDILRLQPVEDRTLKRRWELPNTAAVQEYLDSELSAYHFRDSDQLIWASDAAEQFEKTTHPETTTGEEETDTSGSVDGRDTTEAKSDGAEQVSTEESSQDETPDTTSATMTEGDTDPAPIDDQSETTFWNRSVDSISEFSDEGMKAGEGGDESSGDGPLDKKIDEWKSQLLDLTRRNKLISFKPTKSKSLPFDDADTIELAEVLTGDSPLYIRQRPDEDDQESEQGDSESGGSEDDTEDGIPELGQNEVFPTRDSDAADESLYQISLNHKQHLREKGVDSLYLALGMLDWYSTDYSDETNASPLFLASIKLEESQEGSDRHNYQIERKGESLRLNPALRKKLAAEHNLQLPADSALSLDNLDAAFEAVHEAVQGFSRWQIQNKAILGIFDFAKYGLYADLERNRDAVKADPLVRALNGNPTPLQQAEGDIVTPTAAELDEVVDPIDTYQVLDADSSQQQAIEAAKRGKSFVLQGPPGTGKSQTIANIIGEKIAAGEKVLFVSEKQAALNVVKERLDDVGIGRFCLEVHGAKANNTDVMSSLEDELKASPVKAAGERPQRLAELRDRRDTLNEYGDHLFYSPPEWDLTAYQAYGIVSQHQDAPRISVGIDEPLEVDEQTLTSAIDDLETLAAFDGVLNAYETGLWRHTTLDQWGVDTREAMEVSLDQQMDAVETLQEVADLLDDALQIRPQSLADFEAAANLLEHLLARPELSWQEAFFEESFVSGGGRLQEFVELEKERATLHDDLSSNYERSFFSANGADLNSQLASFGLLKVVKPSYRSLKRQVVTHTTNDYDPTHDELLEDTRKLAEIHRIEDRRDDFHGVIQRLGPLYQGADTDWETISDAQAWVAKLQEFPAEFTDSITELLLAGELSAIESLHTQTQQALNQYKTAAEFFDSAMAVENLQVGQRPFREASFDALADALAQRRTQVPRLQARVQFETQLQAVKDTLCAEYVEAFLAGDYEAEQLVPAFKKRFYTKWLDAVYDQTELGGFSADRIERALKKFQQLDKEQQELAQIQIQHEVTSRRPSLSMEHATSSEQALVRRETEKQRRHKPLRELFAEAGSFITQLTPCFMMSPLSVAQYLQTEAIEFDTVIFDEASQIMPQDAISSLIRADQAVIAGDTKQLPPTSFFQADVETTEDVREDLDSILEEAVAVLPEKDLRWHYRSKTDELIEFSNHFYYNNKLRTFPENDPDVDTGVFFEYVEDGVYDRGGSRQNQVEATRVVDLIAQHAEESSDKSLGVVAFSSAQEQAIRETLEERCDENPVLDAFVDQDDVLDEFFIKNLEMVQGDERDRMIFSVGYGPDSEGRVHQNFGPLNNSGGERRLNVAVSRAKEQVTVVSSIQPNEIDAAGTKHAGVEHFKKYLEYAKNGEQVLARDDAVTESLAFDSGFEEAVYDALSNKGYDVVSQAQSAGYSIDLAIKHPDNPGEFVLGIECDGAAYHSSKTARDRDRTRQAILEDLGWTIHRIWSPDWTSNPDQELAKIDEKISTIIGGETVGEDVEIRTHEVETLAVDSKFAHDDIIEYQSPWLSSDGRYSPDTRGHDQAVKNSLRDIVDEFGPVKKETLFQTALDVWSESRLGKNIENNFEEKLRTLKLQKTVFEADEFIWPQPEAVNFAVRVNTESSARSIEEIPIEEIALALSIILSEGGFMTVEDLELEATRLFGFQRRGKRIQERIQVARERLESIGVLTEEGSRIGIKSHHQSKVKLAEEVYGEQLGVSELTTKESTICL